MATKPKSNPGANKSYGRSQSTVAQENRAAVPAQISTESGLMETFQEYEKLARVKAELNKRVRVLDAQMKPFKEAILAAVKCNNNEVICGPYSAELTQTAGYTVAPGEKLNIHLP